jgi:hypothetical protein
VPKRGALGALHWRAFDPHDRAAGADERHDDDREGEDRIDEDRADDDDDDEDEDECRPATSIGAVALASAAPDKFTCGAALTSETPMKMLAPTAQISLLSIVPPLTFRPRSSPINTRNRGAISAD